MRFCVKGYHPEQGIVSLALEAGSPEQARVQATDRGMDVIAIEQALGWRIRHTERFDVLLFSQEVQALLSAGLSLIETLGALGRKEGPSRKHDLLDGLVGQLREGKAFSVALGAYPREFPPLYRALVAASEKTGDIVHALDRFIAYRARLDEVRKRVVTASLYPALLLGVGGLVVLFLLLYVVPRFTRVYEEFGRQLPLMSRLMMEWGAFVSHHGTLLLGLILLIVVATTLGLRRHSNFGAILLRRLPGLRERLEQYELARFYRTTGLLQQGGIPLVGALEMAAGLLGEELAAALGKVVAELRAGQPFSAAMERHGLAPPVALDLLRVGERTGDLGEKLARVADFFDEEQARWIEWFSRLFEPLLMLAIGLLIALVIVMLYLPIFELAETIQ